MKAHRHAIPAIAGAALLLFAAALEAGQAKPAAPAAPAARPKLVSPVRGEAQIEFLNPSAKADGNMIVTTIRVKNVSPAPIAGFRVEEFWYDKQGQVVTGSPTFRHPKPMQVGEIVEVVLRVPRVAGMDRNQFKFEHANGTVKPTRVPRFKEGT